MAVFTFRYVLGVQVTLTGSYTISSSIVTVYVLPRLGHLGMETWFQVRLDFLSFPLQFKILPSHLYFVLGCEAILQHMNLSLGKEYQKGKTKIFIRHPESLFSLEELRDRTVFSYANKIQRFLRRTAMRKYFTSFTSFANGVYITKSSLFNNRYYYELKKVSNDAVLNKKERRRMSLNRPFVSDYISYRQNFKLKDCLGDKGNLLAYYLPLSPRSHCKEFEIKPLRVFLLG